MPSIKLSPPRKAKPAKKATVKTSALKSPVGWIPNPHDLDLAGLDLDHKCVAELLGIDHEEWQKEIAAHKEFS